MRHQTLTTPTQALYRVFIQPSLQQTSTRLAPRRVLQPTSLYQGPPRSQTRAFSSTPRTLATRPPEKRTQLWDKEIYATRSQLVDPETKSLLPPQLTRHILSQIDSKTHRLVCVTAPPPPRHPSDPNPITEWIPTVRIVSKKEQYEAEKARKANKALAKKNETGGGTKTIELNWAIDGNDLSHRMKRLREFLAEGRKVEVVLAKRKGGRKATGEECEGLVGRISEAVGEVKGAKEGKREGKMGAVMTLVFEPGKGGGSTSSSSSSAAAAVVAGDAVGKEKGVKEKNGSAGDDKEVAAKVDNVIM